MPNGIASFGNSLNFLYSHWITPVGPEASNIQENYHTIISECSSCPQQQVKFVLEPKFTYPETFPYTFELSNVEQNLEKMFAVNSCTSFFNEDEYISDYDKNKRDKFDKQ